MLLPLFGTTSEECFTSPDAAAAETDTNELLEDKPAAALGFRRPELFDGSTLVGTAPTAELMAAEAEATRNSIGFAATTDFGSALGGAVRSRSQ